ncbi:MAG: SLBB domain-containing protein [Nocardioides sp.]
MTAPTLHQLPDLMGSQRLLSCQASSLAAHQDRLGPVPRLDLDRLVALTEESGLTGRGGAGFPTGIKLRAVAEAGRRGVVVGNAMEGEPLSHKDAVLLAVAPHLVLDGLSVLSDTLGARHVVLGVGPDIDPGPVRAALAERRERIEVTCLSGGFVAGQETALVNQLEGRPAVPRDPAVRVTERGHSGHPTLVVNAETLAQLALLARYGAAWFRSAGTPEDPGTSLFTVSGAVSRPGVLEAARGTTLSDVLARAGAASPVAVLVGGYHGAWLPPEAMDTPSPAPRSRRTTLRSAPECSSCSGRTCAHSRRRRRSPATSPTSRPASAARASTASLPSPGR